MKEYNFIKKQPVARLFYKGDHSHPVRRTIVIIQSNDKIITGYELREGSVVRDFKNAPIKSYRKDRIAKVGELDKRRVLRKSTDNLNKSTLVRQHLKDLIKLGA